MTRIEEIPVAVIGAGPVGLAAAAHLIERGVAVKVYEAAPTVGANLRDWGHVRIFTPWELNVDTAARALLERRGGAPAALAAPRTAPRPRSWSRVDCAARDRTRGCRWRGRGREPSTP